MVTITFDLGHLLSRRIIYYCKSLRCFAVPRMREEDLGKETANSWEYRL